MHSLPLKNPVFPFPYSWPVAAATPHSIFFSPKLSALSLALRFPCYLSPAWACSGASGGSPNGPSDSDFIFFVFGDAMILPFPFFFWSPVANFFHHFSFSVYQFWDNFFILSTHEVFIFFQDNRKGIAGTRPGLSQPILFWFQGGLPGRELCVLCCRRSNPLFYSFLAKNLPYAASPSFYPELHRFWRVFGTHPPPFFSPTQMNNRMIGSLLVSLLVPT